MKYSNPHPGYEFGPIPFPISIILSMPHHSCLKYIFSKVDSNQCNSFCFLFLIFPGNHHPYKVQQEFEIQFQGPCEQNNPLLYSKLSAAVTQYLDARNHCWDVKCEFSNLTILCGPSTENRRYRRSDYFTVMWNVTISNE